MNPTRLINAVAPTRICDVGGWTDTWFAKHGRVFNVAISPQVEVQITVTPATDGPRIVIRAENYNEAYPLDPGHILYGKHPLIEAAVEEMNWPEDIAIHVNLFSSAPPGASMGTSAAVSVALIGALDALTEGRLSAHDTAVLAHSLETEKLGLECGVQDQLASAYGGVNLIHMTDYPKTTVTPIRLPDELFWDFEQRLLLIYIGKPHNSSETHKKVIADLGRDPSEDARLQRLRELALEAQAALSAHDFPALGGVFNANTDVQRALHPDLVCPAFEEIMQIAADHEALGCKVNGAGGDGGSIAVLTRADMFQKRALEKALAESGYQSLPVHLTRRGLRVWTTEI
ncbi:MAG: GHMP kinase [Verrucomicrobia bacterium]|nr:GHMP kinase [Verrucomicrobiota bacterium]MCH8512525.1 GHMP kinase [Kiritimatiellia bacterium]